MVNEPLVFEPLKFYCIYGKDVFFPILIHKFMLKVLYIKVLLTWVGTQPVEYGHICLFFALGAALKVPEKKWFHLRVASNAGGIHLQANR